MDEHIQSDFAINGWHDSRASNSLKNRLKGVYHEDNPSPPTTSYFFIAPLDRAQLVGDDLVWANHSKKLQDFWCSFTQWRTVCWPISKKKTTVIAYHQSETFIFSFIRKKTFLGIVPVVRNSKTCSLVGHIDTTVGLLNSKINLNDVLERIIL